MRAVLATLLVAATPALAADDDAKALTLADQTEAAPLASSDWRIFVEGALRESTLRGGGSTQANRWSIDLRYDALIAPGWRAVFADRLDTIRSSGFEQTQVNTLKEAYLSWQARTDVAADLGRINARYGVALGYNPTDFFRVGALRSVVSIAPASLRENRLGAVMLRGQKLWEGGSLTALYSPKLADHPSRGSFDVDLGATNSRERWLAALSHRFSDDLQPQFLLHGVAGEPVQFGINLTRLLNDATVGFVEWSGGRSRSMLAQALSRPEDSAFRSRLATGVTYTTSANLSLTLEYEYNGIALDRAGWDALRRGPLAVYGRYRAFAADLQEPVTRHHWFLYGAWTDALVKHLDLTAMIRYDVADRSRLQWFEARYHWTQVDLALQLQFNRGEPSSDFGALPERRSAQVLLKYFFQ